MEDEKDKEIDSKKENNEDWKMDDKDEWEVNDRVGPDGFERPVCEGMLVKSNYIILLSIIE